MRLYGISGAWRTIKNTDDFCFKKPPLRREFSVDRLVLDGKLEYQSNFDSNSPRKKNFLAAFIQKIERAAAIQKKEYFCHG
jgi:hypothetical protein